ncbi:hypothetical protein [Lactobacillus amylovorus]|uniref:hypothetical protein n=1 Tax=Lactobacillus amylovorus TaxID=1604 RepID=UPI00201DCDD1|nr:hypothetical protein [Lactobacillus amylovorus]
MKVKKQKVTYMMKDGRAISIVEDYETIKKLAQELADGRQAGSYLVVSVDQKKYYLLSPEDISLTEVQDLEEE